MLQYVAVVSVTVVLIPVITQLKALFSFVNNINWSLTNTYYIVFGKQMKYSLLLCKQTMKQTNYLNNVCDLSLCFDQLNIDLISVPCVLWCEISSVKLSFSGTFRFLTQRSSTCLLRSSVTPVLCIYLPNLNCLPDPKFIHNSNLCAQGDHNFQRKGHLLLLTDRSERWSTARVVTI